MKTLLILGGGTGGTMVANKMAHHLDLHEWRIVVVDKEENHYYQPGFLFIPFGIYSQADVIKPKRNFLPAGVKVIFSEIELIETVPVPLHLPPCRSRTHSCASRRPPGRESAPGGSGCRLRSPGSRSGSPGYRLSA